MKIIKSILAILLLSMTFTACTDDNEDSIVAEENPLADYNKLTSFSANEHTIEIYSEQQAFTVGYNELFFRIKDNVENRYIEDVQISWTPMMHMTNMQHSCPKSEISKGDHPSVYKGFAIFQMPGNQDEYWNITLDYETEGKTYSITEQITVSAPADGNKRINVFTGSDDVRYVLAMILMQPEVKVNDFSAMLFKMENMMNFSVVENYKIMIDPRMPSMGNHSSPNNEDLAFDHNSDMYKGKLSLTMTGYWKINLMVENELGQVLKGEEVTEESESSSLFFEIEF